MARRALKTINWAGLAELIPESEKNMLATLKSKTDQYLRKYVCFIFNSYIMDIHHFFMNFL